MKRYLKIIDTKCLDKEISYCDMEKINRITKRYDWINKEYWLYILFNNGISHKYKMEDIKLEEMNNMEIEDILNIEELTK